MGNRSTYQNDFIRKSVPENRDPSQKRTGQSGDFTVKLNRKRSVCPRDGSRFVPGTGCDGLSQQLVLFVPNTVPPKMFTITHTMMTELIRKRFWFGNSFTEITEYDSQNISVGIR